MRSCQNFTDVDLEGKTKQTQLDRHNSELTGIVYL